jgi:hypothetical protein
MVQLQCPPGVTHFYGQRDSYIPNTEAPAIYQPVDGVLTIPASLLSQDMLGQGYTILDGTPPPGPRRGWSFRDLPFLTWLNNKPW